MTTETTKHTPGPWEISIAGGCTILGNDGLVPVAQPYIFRDEPALTDANTRLIVSAPDMLAILADWSVMEQRADDSGANDLGFYLAQAKEYNALLERARAAIAKATGAS